MSQKNSFPPNLSKELKRLFLPIIRNRGNKYAKENRVKIEVMEPGLIKGVVSGTSKYKVYLALEDHEEGLIKIGCTCPFFRQGIPCKHIWALIVTGEKELNTKSSAPAPRTKRMDLDEIFDSDFWEISTNALPWKPVQDFILRYQLTLKETTVELSAFEQYVKKNGELGRVRKLQNKTIANPKLPKEDKLILPYLKELIRESDFSFFYHIGHSTDSFRSIHLTQNDLESLLPILADTRRCKVTNKDKVIADPLLKASPMLAKFEISTRKLGKNNFELVPEIVLPQGERIHLKDTILFNTKPVLFIAKGLLYQLKGPNFSWLRRVRNSGFKAVNKNGLKKLIRQALSVSRLEYLNIPQELSPKRLEVEGLTPGLILKIEGRALKARPFFEYNNYRVESDGSGEEIFDEANWQVIRRDTAKEKEFIDTLLAYGFTATDMDYRLSLESATEILEELEKKGVLLEAEDGKPFQTGNIRGFSISSGIDWFDMEAEVDFGGEQVPLPMVVNAYLRGKKTIRLASGGHGILPSKWIERHKKILELARVEKDSKGKATFRFPSTHALLLDALLEEVQHARSDERFKIVRDRLKNFKGIRPLKAPPGFKGRLRPYQEEALGWFKFLHHLGFGGILADDMGLGKTIQVLAWLEAQYNVPGPSTDNNNQEEQREQLPPSLVIAPTSLVFNWQAEAERFTPGLKIFPYIGPNRPELFKKFNSCHVVLTTYGILRRDITSLKDMEFYYCILDESQYIKNPDSMTAKAARILKAQHRLCLTGTPIENHLGELWSQMEFLNPGMLGKKDRYMERFARPVAAGDEKVLSGLKQMIAPFILRRTKQEVAKELPDKIESIIRCTMTPEQSELYQQIRDHYRSSILQSVEQKGIKRSKMMVLEGLLRLRQAANHPALVGDTTRQSGKFIQLLELLEETISAGHKVLIFSQFTKMLKLIKDELIKKNMTFEYLDGRTPQAKRKERVRNFQENQEVRAFLISLKAGGFGLNLTSADYVFIVDPWWNPAVELQAIDRTHRIGQTKSVVTYRLISKDSVEEKVLNLQKKKQEIVGSILSGSKNLLTNLTAKDLEILFS